MSVRAYARSRPVRRDEFVCSDPIYRVLRKEDRMNAVTTNMRSLRVTGGPMNRLTTNWELETRQRS